MKYCKVLIIGLLVCGLVGCVPMYEREGMYEQRERYERKIKELEVDIDTLSDIVIEVEELGEERARRSLTIEKIKSNCDKTNLGVIALLSQGLSKEQIIDLLFTYAEGVAAMPEMSMKDFQDAMSYCRQINPEFLEVLKNDF